MKTKTAPVINLKAVIEANNEIFSKASLREKRILIARDVISRLDSCQYIPYEGMWVSIEDDYAIAGSESLQKCIIKGKKKCYCCGVGSVFLSTVVFKNKITFGQLNSGVFDFGEIDLGQQKDLMGVMRIFGRKRLYMIEAAFECGYGYVNDTSGKLANLYGDVIKRAVKFGLRFTNEKKRLTAIMQNIIDNGGEFIP